MLTSLRSAAVAATIQPRARRTDPDTSHRAARSMVTEAATQRTAIWNALRTHGPAGLRTIASHTGLTDVQVGRRMKELVDHQLAEVVPDRFEKTPTGRRGQVWRATA